MYWWYAYPPEVQSLFLCFLMYSGPFNLPGRHSGQAFWFPSYYHKNRPAHKDEINAYRISHRELASEARLERQPPAVPSQKGSAAQDWNKNNNRFPGPRIASLVSPFWTELILWHSIYGYPWTPWHPPHRGASETAITVYPHHTRPASCRNRSGASWLWGICPLIAATVSSACSLWGAMLSILHNLSFRAFIITPGGKSHFPYQTESSENPGKRKAATWTQIHRRTPNIASSVVSWALSDQPLSLIGKYCSSSTYLEKY